MLCAFCTGGGAEGEGEEVEGVTSTRREEEGKTKRRRGEETSRKTRGVDEVVRHHPLCCSTKVAGLGQLTFLGCVCTAAKHGLCQHAAA